LTLSGEANGAELCNPGLMGEPYVTSHEAAKAIGVGLSTLQAWAQRGVITPAWRTPGGQARWDVADLRRQLGMPPPAEDAPATRPEPQPVVAAIVTSDRGVLAGRRNDGKPPWTFIAGEIEPGESPADAGVREVKEETGLLVAAGPEIGRRVHPATQRTMIYMAARPTHGTDVWIGDIDELAEVRWLTLAEADELLPGMYEPVRDYLAQTIGRQAS
jgi:8-oxo-dGTP pyrophosphatase MutT (NUDIX family)